LDTLNSQLVAVRGGTDPAMQKLGQLVGQANANAGTYTPAWPTPDSQVVYECAAFMYIPATSSGEGGSFLSNPRPCTVTEFTAHQKSLADQARAALKTAVDAVKGAEEWNQISTALAVVATDSARIKSHLNCDPVFKLHKGMRDHVCGGVVGSYWNAGGGWCLAGACALMAAYAQYKLWKHLKDNRSLYFDEHPEEYPVKFKKFLNFFFGCAVGEPGELEEEAPLTDEDGEKKGCFGCGKGGGDSEPKPAKAAKPAKKKGKGDPAADRITAKFNAAFDVSVEEAVKTFLTDEVYSVYDPAFIEAAVKQRASSLAAKNDPKKKKPKKEPPDPVMPEEPAGGDPKKLFDGQYSDLDDVGMPKADMEGNPLDKKTLAKVKKQFDPVKKAWDKYLADKKTYETFALNKARRESLEEGAEVIFPDELQYLRPISTKTNKPLKIILSGIPEDKEKAVFSDELAQVKGEVIDPQIRKQKPIAPKFKGLHDRCFEATKTELISKLMNLSKSDAAIWEGCAAEAPKAKPKKEKGPKKVGKEPKPPKEPKGLVDPAELFTTGKHEGKYEEDRDEEGVLPLKKTGGDELTDKEKGPLKKEYDKVKGVWDKHQAAVAKYDEDMKAFKEANGEGEKKEEEEEKPPEEPEPDDPCAKVPDEQKEASCSTAGKGITQTLVDKLLAEHIQELAAKVNGGEHDTEELKAVLVTETLEEEEIITDPVLKAFRRFDEERTNACASDNLKGIFEALGEDELEVGTHKYYSEVTEDEINFAQGKMESAGAVSDGALQYDGLKTFIEDSDVQTLAGKEPTNLVSCLMALRIDTWFSEGTVDTVYSPRTWRGKLGEEFGESGAKKGGKSKRSSKADDGEMMTSEGNPYSSEDAGEDGGKKKGKRSSKSEESGKSKRKSQQGKEPKEEEEEDGKKDKKEKKEKKSKK